MTTTNTSRIDIENIRNCCGPPVTICRTMPAILGSHMREYEWTQFCDKVDEVLEPISHLKRKAQLSMLFLGLVNVAISLAFIFLFVNDSGSYEGPNFSFFILPVVGFIVTFAVFWTLAIIWGRKSQKIQDELSKVCHEQSSKNPMVSVHVRKETHITGSGDSRSTCVIVYLEVQVSPNASATSSYAPSAPVYEGSIPTATPVFGGESRSVEMRLEELERLKPQLSEEEYRRKREDILSMV